MELAHEDLFELRQRARLELRLHHGWPDGGRLDRDHRLVSRGVRRSGARLHPLGDRAMMRRITANPTANEREQAQLVRGLERDVPNLPVAMTILDRLALYYIVRTERFDRRVCTGPMGQDGILPASMREQHLSEYHARDVHQLVSKVRRTYNLDYAEYGRTRNYWNRIPFEECERLAAMIFGLGA